MKKTTHKIIPLIRQAINIIEDRDLSLEDVKIYLVRALNILQKTQKKRERKNAESIRFAEEAKKNAENWQKMIEDNAKKFAAEALKKRNQE